DVSPYATKTTPHTLIYTLSLHDALPISPQTRSRSCARVNTRSGWLMKKCSSRNSVAPSSTRIPPPVIRCAAGSRRNPAISTTSRSEEHTSELQSRVDLVCRLLLEKKKTE